MGEIRTPGTPHIRLLHDNLGHSVDFSFTAEAVGSSAWLGGDVLAIEFVLVLSYGRFDGLLTIRAKLPWHRWQAPGRYLSQLQVESRVVLSPNLPLTLIPPLGMRNSLLPRSRIAQVLTAL